MRHFVELLISVSAMYGGIWWNQCNLNFLSQNLDDVQFTSIYRKPYIYWETKSRVPVGFASSPAIDFLAIWGLTLKILVYSSKLLLTLVPACPPWINCKRSCHPSVARPRLDYCTAVGIEELADEGAKLWICEGKFRDGEKNMFVGRGAFKDGKRTWPLL